MLAEPDHVAQDRTVMCRQWRAGFVTDEKPDMRTFMILAAMAVSAQAFAQSEPGPGATHPGQAVRGPLREAGLGVSSTLYAVEQPAPRTDAFITWQWLILDQPQDSEQGPVDTLATRTEVDCTARTLRPVGFEAYYQGRLTGAVPDSSFEAETPDSSSALSSVIQISCFGPTDLPRFADIDAVRPLRWTGWVELDMGGLTHFPGGPERVVMVNEGTIQRPAPAQVAAVFLVSNGSVMAPAVVSARLDCAAGTYLSTGQWALTSDEAVGGRLRGEGSVTALPLSEAPWLEQSARTLCAGDPLDPDLPRHATVRDAQIAGGMAEDVREGPDER